MRHKTTIDLLVAGSVKGERGTSTCNAEIQVVPNVSPTVSLARCTGKHLFSLHTPTWRLTYPLLRNMVVSALDAIFLILLSEVRA